MTSEENVLQDNDNRWEALECMLGRNGPLQRSEFEPSTEMVRLLTENVRVLVVGAGGLGCEILKSLAFMGFCNIDVIDMDTIDISNLNRQFLFTDKDIGRSKAEVAAEFIMRRVETCKVTPHNKRIQDFGPDFYRQFEIVLCGLDSVIARRWINSMLASLVKYNEDGTPDLHTIIPLVDGGTEGFKGHVIVVLFGFTGCIECSLGLYPPQVNFPLCTIAHTPRLPEHCVEYVRLLLWPKEQPFGPNVAIDGDSPEHLEWIYNQSCERAKGFGIQGVNMRLVKGVVKRIIPAVASTNAVIASAIVTEAFKLLTICYDYLNNYMNFADIEGIYTYRFQIERKSDCLVCNNTPKLLRLSPKSTLRDLVDHLKQDSDLQMQSPTVMTVMNGANRTLFVDFDEAMHGLRDNLPKTLEGTLGLRISSLAGLSPLRGCAVVLITRASQFSSQHRANYRHQLRYVSLSEEPFATSVPPNAPNLLLPPPLDPPLINSVSWSSLDPSTTLLIDSRSPSEYAADHIQGAVNVPILSDIERAEVGIAFSGGNTLEARLKGARFACNNIAESLRPEGPLARLLDTQSKSSSSVSDSVSPLTLVVYCARGGQRSMGMATILAELHCSNCEVMCLAGGYKAWRRLLVRQLNCWPLQIGPDGMAGNLWVLSSLTGCGKTLLLGELEKSGEHVLNLERMAEHKGSMFGSSGFAKTPMQKIFEARLHAALRSCLNVPRIWTECESKSVGPSCHLNEGFWRRLRGIQGTKRIWLSASLNSRVDYILRDYADWAVCSEEKHEWVLKSLAKYHSRKRLESWRGLMQRGDFAAFVADLLEHHYDPLYKKSRGPMLQQFADHGLLHHIELPTISQSYFRLEVARLFGKSLVILANELSFLRCVRGLQTSTRLQRHPGIVYPTKLSWQWLIEKHIDPTQYTVNPVKKIRTGGRGPDGQIQYKHHTTGLNRPYFLVDYVRSRQMETKRVHEEVILKIAKNWWRDPYLALTACGEVKRWIVATSTMKEGDVIRSHWEIPTIPALPVPGDAYPVGALPVGTQVCLIELHPGQGAELCRAAGATATIVRRGTAVHDLDGLNRQLNDMLSAEPIDDCYTCVLQHDSSKREIRLLPTCVVVVGQVSNESHNKEKYRKFGEKYWHGIKQRSGLYQKKTGRFGRKIYPVDPLLDCTKSVDVSDGEIKAKFTLSDRPEAERQRDREVFADSLLMKRRKIRPVPGPHNDLPHTLPEFTWRHV